MRATSSASSPTSRLTATPRAAVPRWRETHRWASSRDSRRPSFGREAILGLLSGLRDVTIATHPHQKLTGSDGLRTIGAPPGTEAETGTGACQPASKRGPRNASVRSLVTRARVIPFKRLFVVRIPVPGCFTPQQGVSNETITTSRPEAAPPPRPVTPEADQAACRRHRLRGRRALRCRPARS